MTVEPSADDASAFAAPLRTADDATIASLRLSLSDDGAPLAARYRALFSLRNLAGEKAEQALVEGESVEVKGALKSSDDGYTLAASSTCFLPLNLVFQKNETKQKKQLSPRPSPPSSATTSPSASVSEVPALPSPP